jgi:biotin transport system substrate-specific component
VIPLPFTPVPITGQTLGVLLVGASLGPAFGAASLGLYLLQGGLGAPFFADGGSGWEALGRASVTGGYLWGFLLAAAFVGGLARRGWDRSFGSAVGAMFLGEVVIYAVGLPWLRAATDATLEQTLEWGLYPFVIGDTFKLLIAAGLLPVAWWSIDRFRPEGA